MLDLGTMIAESFDPGGGRFRSEMSVPPSIGDLAEVTFDVVGLLDNAQLGWRLHIFGQPTAGAEGFLADEHRSDGAMRPRRDQRRVLHLAVTRVQERPVLRPAAAPGGLIGHRGL
jgi:hypothetical protein